MAMNTLLRVLMAVGGVGLVAVDWPVAKGAWQAQYADAATRTLFPDKPTRMSEVVAGLAALDRSVASDPVARRYLQRSEYLATAALGTSMKVPPETQKAWLQRARADLEIGLANAPARGSDWLRLAIVRQAQEGPSRDIVRLLMMSIDMAPAQS